MKQLIFFALFINFILSGCIKGEELTRKDTNLFSSRMEEKREFSRQERKVKPDYFELAKVLAAKKFYDVALMQLKKAKDEGGHLAGVCYLMGVCCREKGEYEKAVEHFKKSLSIDINYAAAHDGLGITYDLLAKGDLAIACYKKAISLNPARAGFYNNIGFSELIKGHFEEAENNFLAGIALDPDFVKAQRNLAILYGMTGREKDALKLLRELLPLHEAYNDMGVILQLKGESKMARKMYGKARGIKPDFLVAQDNLDRLKKNLENGGPE